MNKNFTSVVQFLRVPNSRCLGRECRKQRKYRRIFLLYVLLAISSWRTAQTRVASRSLFLITTDRHTSEWWGKLLFNIPILLAATAQSPNFIHFRVSFMRHHVSVLAVARSSNPFWKEKSTPCYLLLQIPCAHDTHPDWCSHAGVEWTVPVTEVHISNHSLCWGPRHQINYTHLCRITTKALVHQLQ